MDIEHMWAPPASAASSDRGPNGSIEGLFVIIAAQTGVTHETQCGGLRCQHPSLEGFLVPCSSKAYDLDGNIEADLEDFFFRRFRNQGDHGDTWAPEAVDELEKLINRVAFWPTPAHANNEYLRLELDRSRLADCTEAWIPVLTPYGPGILTLAAWQPARNAKGCCATPWPRTRTAPRPARQAVSQRLDLHRARFSLWLNRSQRSCCLCDPTASLTLSHWPRQTPFFALSRSVHDPDSTPPASEMTRIR
jgi:hypothetical protein